MITIAADSAKPPRRRRIAKSFSELAQVPGTSVIRSRWGDVAIRGNSP